jgi:hypothetical protein
MLGRTGLVAIVAGLLFSVALTSVLPRDAHAQSQRRTDGSDAGRGTKQPGDDSSIAPGKPIDSDGVLQPRASEEEPAFSDWLPQGGYQQLFDSELKARRYPVIVEGRSISGNRQFRARFVPFPGGPFAFWSHHGISEEMFNRRDRELTREGARLISKQVAADRGGRFVQGTWVRP